MSTPNPEEFSNYIATLAKDVKAEEALPSSQEKFWFTDPKYSALNLSFNLLLGGPPKQKRTSDPEETPRQKEALLRHDEKRGYAFLKLPVDQGVGDRLYTYAIQSLCRLKIATDEGSIKSYSPTAEIKATEAMWVTPEHDDTSLVNILCDVSRFEQGKLSNIISVIKEVWPFYIFEITVPNRVDKLYFFKFFDPCFAARRKCFSAKMGHKNSNLAADSNPYLMFAHDYDLIISTQGRGMWVLDLEVYDKLTQKRIIERATSDDSMAFIEKMLSLDKDSRRIIKAKIRQNKDLAKIVDTAYRKEYKIEPNENLHAQLATVKEECGWENVTLTLQANGTPAIRVTESVKTKTVEQILLVMNEQNYQTWSSKKIYFADKATPGNQKDSEVEAIKIQPSKAKVGVPLNQGTLFDLNND